MERAAHLDLYPSVFADSYLVGGRGMSTQKKSLQERMAEIINSDWHYSWHWPRGQFGNLTIEGYRKALQDAIDLRLHYNQRSEDLAGIIDEISQYLSQCEEAE